MNLTPVLVAAIVAGVTALDNVHMLQWMLSRPVAAGTIIGALLGNVGAGMICGAWIELIWLGVLPIGNYTPPDAHITAVTAATAAVVWTAGDMPLAMTPELRVAAALLAVLACVPVGVFSKLADLELRRHLAGRAEKLLAGEPPYRVGGMLLVSTLPVFAKAFCAVIIVRIMAVVLQPVVAVFLAEARVARGLTFAASLVPALGMVQLARCIGAKGREKWVLLGALAAVIVLFSRGIAP